MIQYSIRNIILGYLRAHEYEYVVFDRDSSVFLLLSKETFKIFYETFKYTHCALDNIMQVIAALNSCVLCSTKVLVSCEHFRLYLRTLVPIRILLTSKQLNDYRHRSFPNLLGGLRVPKMQQQQCSVMEKIQLPSCTMSK